MLKSLMQTIREELELSAPFDQNALLGANQTARYRCVRCLLESTAAKGHIFVSEGELRRVQINHPQLGPQEGINDTRVFEGWKTRP
jgi:hypothetical protein